MVYRQQATNAAFPRVSGNLVQVTPLLESILFQGQQNQFVTVPDSLIALGYETIKDRTHYMLYVRDQQPVIRGASYHYYVAHFNSQHEVEETIDAGTVTIPSQ